MYNVPLLNELWAYDVKLNSGALFSGKLYKLGYFGGAVPTASCAVNPLRSALFRSHRGLTLT